MDNMWFWSGDSLDWNPFSDSHNSQLTAAKANGPVGHLHIQGTDYSIDFLQNTQLNCSSGRIRRIHQGFPDGPPAPINSPTLNNHAAPQPQFAAWGDDEDEEDDEDYDEDEDDEDDDDEDEDEEEDEDDDEDDDYDDGQVSANSLPVPEPDEEMDEAAPKHLICPLTQSLMHDPVTITTGNTYERSSIAKWFKKHSTDPLSNVQLTEKMLIPNIVVRQAIEQFKEDFEKEKANKPKQSSDSITSSSSSNKRKKADEDEVEGCSSRSKP